MSEPGSAENQESHTAVVTFGRPVTEDDLQKLQSVTDALEASVAARVDEDHIHRP